MYLCDVNECNVNGNDGNLFVLMNVRSVSLNMLLSVAMNVTFLVSMNVTSMAMNVTFSC